MIGIIIGIIIGALICGIGIYYAVQSKKEDGKVFGFYKALIIIGAVFIVLTVTLSVIFA